MKMILFLFVKNVEYVCVINVKIIIQKFFKIIIYLNLKKIKILKIYLLDFVKKKNHQVELKYFCKTHNILCCAEYIAKVKKNYSGQHHDCDVCIIEDVENDKKNKLKENIKIIEDLSINLQKIINDLKIIIEKIDKNKEELKMNIQKIFTKLRNTLNDREDELLLEIDKKYNELYLNEEIIKEIDKFPNKIKIYLEKGKEIENNWNNNKLNSLINDCLNIENNIKNINKIKESISKNNSLKFELRFISD